MNERNHGGRREGSGRKPIHNEGAHKERPPLNPKQPLHVTVRLKDDLPSLREPDLYSCILKAIKRAEDFGLRVIQFSVLSNHIHLIVEVDNEIQLQRGMMSFNGKLARAIRKHPEFDVKKFPRGLFTSRYFQKAIKSARQMRNTLKYVLLNAAKHFKRVAYIDQFSSGSGFRQWRELLQERFDGLIMEQVLSIEELGTKHRPQKLSKPKTWLATKGWKTAS